MQPAWLRSFAEQHYPMLYWLGGVAFAVVGVTLVLWSAVQNAPFALLAVPLLLFSGLAAALAEIVQALRHHHGDPRTIGFNVLGTIGLGFFGLPLSAALAFVTLWNADNATFLCRFPTYRHIITDVQNGAIMPTGEWQQRDDVAFMTDAYPRRRIIFRLPGSGYSQSGIVYDPAGEVATHGPGSLTAEAPPYQISHATVRDCHATLITAYYQCDMWEFDGG